MTVDLLIAGVAGIGIGIGLVAGAYAMRFLRRITRNGDDDR